MKITNHDEIENKYYADHIEAQAFNSWCLSLGPSRYVNVQGPDAYYRQGKNVVRHRISPESKAGELTVKTRRSHTSTQNRQEVDLHFAEDINILDVQTFLTATGFRRELTLIKDCHIFWFKHVSVVLYDVWRLDEQNSKNKLDLHRFLEVEVEKDSGLDHDEAQSLLLRWCQLIDTCFGLKQPVNESLYELYSGKRYRMERRG